MIFLTTWQKPLSLYVAVVLVKESDAWVVDGWRGFVSEPDGLLDGTNQTNAFPPGK